MLFALAAAGLVNMAMVMMAARVPCRPFRRLLRSRPLSHARALLGIGAAGVFLLSLIASGISSSVVGTMAGQMIMQGFVGFSIPIWLRA